MQYKNKNNFLNINLIDIKRQRTNLSSPTVSHYL